jgi:hypothetical protein
MTTHILFALVLLIEGNYHLVEMFPTKSSCEYYKKLQRENAVCFPVNVTAKEEVEQQINALNLIIK